MSGFPIRPDRLAFGPKPQNRFEVRDSAKELDGPTIGDLMMWQIAGVGVVVARAVAIIALDASGVPSLYAHAEAWNPNGTAAAPTLTDNGNGSYKLSYGTAYGDKDSTSQALALEGAAAFPQTTDDYRGAAEVQSNGYEVEVRVRNSAGTLTDLVSKNVLVVSW